MFHSYVKLPECIWHANQMSSPKSLVCHAELRSRCPTWFFFERFLQQMMKTPGFFCFHWRWATNPLWSWHPGLYCITLWTSACRMYSSGRTRRAWCALAQPQQASPFKIRVCWWCWIKSVKLILYIFPSPFTTLKSPYDSIPVPSVNLT